MGDTKVDIQSYNNSQIMKYFLPIKIIIISYCFLLTACDKNMKKPARPQGAYGEKNKMAMTGVDDAIKGVSAYDVTITSIEDKINRALALTKELQYTLDPSKRQYDKEISDSAYLVANPPSSLPGKGSRNNSKGNGTGSK